jgi:hypothetical protein
VSVADIVVAQSTLSPRGIAVDIPAVNSKTWDQMSVLEKMRYYATDIVPGAVADTFGVGRPSAPTILSTATGGVGLALKNIIGPITGPVVIIGIVAVLVLAFAGRVTR